MLGSLVSFRDALAADGRHNLAALLTEGESVVQARYECFGPISKPLKFTSDVAWSLYRQVVCNADYWVRPDELALVATVVGVNVEIAVYDPVSRMFNPLACALPCPGSSAKVGLDLGASPGGVRGHFVRLWTLEEWEAHKNILAKAVDEDNKPGLDNGGVPEDVPTDEPWGIENMHFS